MESDDIKECLLAVIAAVVTIASAYIAARWQLGRSRDRKKK